MRPCPCQDCRSSKPPVYMRSTLRSRRRQGAGYAKDYSHFRKVVYSGAGSVLDGLNGLNGPDVWSMGGPCRQFLKERWVRRDRRDRCVTCRQPAQKFLNDNNRNMRGRLPDKTLANLAPWRLTRPAVYTKADSHRHHRNTHFTLRVPGGYSNA
jgi:hypothetical protein